MIKSDHGQVETFIIHVCYNAGKEDQDDHYVDNSLNIVDNADDPRYFPSFAAAETVADDWNTRFHSPTYNGTIPTLIIRSVFIRFNAFDLGTIIKHKVSA